MRLILWSAASAAMLLAAGCGRPTETPQGPRDGRYLGVGVYPAGDGWAKMAGAAKPADAAVATLADDEHVIVVVDSRTGEVRQCGDLSGHCIGLDPWARPLGDGARLPVRMGDRTAAPVPATTTAPTPG